MFCCSGVVRGQLDDIGEGPLIAIGTVIQKRNDAETIFNSRPPPYGGNDRRRRRVHIRGMRLSGRCKGYRRTLNSTCSRPWATLI